MANSESGEDLNAQGQGDYLARTLRLRIAYMYYVERMTQSEIAAKLGIGRVTVVRHLNEARRRREVRFWIEGALAESVALEQQLQNRFGLERAVIAPNAGESVNVTRLVGFRTGMFVSQLLRDGISLGVGWGRTLHRALETLSAQDVQDLGVVSLLGGIYHAREHNPSEFAWQVASILGADCYLFTAPAVVDSVETKTALLERCGLDTVVRKARNVDVALFGVGSMHPEATTLRYGRGMLPRNIRTELLETGAVGDICFHFFDRQGQLVDHPVNDRIMSVPVDMLHSVPQRVLAAGGREKLDALLAGMKLLKPTVLITEETTAQALLDRTHPETIES